MDKIDGLQKQFGEDMIKRVTDMPACFDVISSGVMALDLALGIGGFPRDHLSVIYGPSGGGKTTLLDCHAAEVIRKGGTPFLIDMEKKGSASWRMQNISAFGVDPSKMAVAQPATGVDALNMVLKTIGKVDSILLDSVFHLITPGELDAKSAGDRHPAALASLVSSNMKPITSKLHGSGTALVWTNQIRHTFNQWKPNTMPGGEAIDFTPIIHVEVSRWKMIKNPKNDSEFIGIWSKANVTKNQAAAPFRKAEFAIFFDSGLDRNFDAWETAKALGVVEQKASWYSWHPDDGGFNIQGDVAAKKYLKEQIPDAIPLLHQEVHEAIRELWSNR